MRSLKIIHTVSCHAEGEVGDVIVGGVAPPPGDSIWEQSRWIAKDGNLRNFMLNEPRGGVFRHVNLLVPPKNPKAQAAFIIMEPEDTPPMSGSNTICVATVLLETGIVPMSEPQTTVLLEAPAGLVEVVATCRGGRVVSVKIINVPSFATQLDTVLEVEGLGTLSVDIAYGGDSFVITDAQALGFLITPDEARDIAQTGVRITRAANEQIGFRHPGNADWSHISFCQIVSAPEQVDGVLQGRNAVTIMPGKIDRSPTGTGCSARLAVMHARGEIRVGEAFTGISITGSRFYCAIESETTVHGLPGVVPSVAGRGFITGTHQHLVDPEDPWPQGYRLSDTWPKI